MFGGAGRDGGPDRGPEPPQAGPAELDRECYEVHRERASRFTSIEDPDIKEPGALRFMVSDTGIGIPAEKIKSVFKRFVQADSLTTRTYGGSGSGLTISKRLVELMGGGRIWVDSVEGRGSTFSFTARSPATVSEPSHHIGNRSGRSEDIDRGR